jgi:cAMP-specific phosphodiesterase 4
LPFCTKFEKHKQKLFQNTSVLENHHWRSAVGCLLESGVAEQLLPHRNKLELQIRDLILATDINRQQEFLTKFKVSNQTLGGRFS